ncbi:hypothetical protein [Sphingomonas kyeonggiensis]|nr:hypothetical protein [Sphingomonas kyeonggiensis]
MNEARSAMDTSLLNGLISVIAMLKGQGLLNDGHVRVIHEQMAKPLELPNRANNPGVQLAQSYLDQMFAGLLPPRK